MSASTVSITAAVRRREGSVAKKIGTELEDVDATNPLENGGDVDTHQREQHLVVGKLKETPKARKALADSAIASRRSKKSTPKCEKRKWQTVFGVLVRNLLLLLIMIGLVQVIRKVALNSADVSIGTVIGISEFEMRIAEVESFVKKTAKMVQIQVDAVDMKVDREMGELRKEMDNRIEEKNSEIAGHVEAMDVSIRQLEEAVAELAKVDVLTKQEFNTFYDALVKTEANDSGHGTVTLDNVRTVAREMVEKEIDRHAADGLGMVDYALAAGGAVVISHSGTLHRRWFNLGFRGVHPDSSKMLSPSFGEPGQCFPLKGSSGFVEIRLRTAIIPTALTLEHASKSVCYDQSSAPREWRVVGWLQGRYGDEQPQQEAAAAAAAEAKRMRLLGEFIYSLGKSSAQTHRVASSDVATAIDVVRLEIISNHGNSDFTCIYRFRVHGRSLSP